VNNGFWSMGGYASYVWPCFAFACLVLAWNLWAARRFRAAAGARAAPGATEAIDLRALEAPPSCPGARPKPSCITH